MSSSTPAARCLRFGIAWIVLTALCMLFVDGAASSWSYSHLHRPEAFVDLTHLVDPLQALAALALAVIGIRVLASSWRPGRWGCTVMAASLALIISYSLKEQLKHIFGRTWPETWVGRSPSWISNHVSGFNFFHGGEGWASFPSGHTTQMFALMAVLWVRVPGLRVLWGVFALAVPVGLFGSDFHFVGDMMAGAFLGVATAAGVMAFVREPDAPGQTG